MELEEALKKIGPILAGQSPEEQAARQEGAGIVCLEALRIGEALAARFQALLDAGAWEDVVNDRLERWLTSGFAWAAGEDLESGEALLRKRLMWDFLDAARKVHEETDRRRGASAGSFAPGSLSAVSEEGMQQIPAPEFHAAAEAGDDAKTEFQSIVEAVDARAANSTVAETFDRLRRINAGDLSVPEAIEEADCTRATFDKRNSRALQRVRDAILQRESSENRQELLTLLATFKLRGGL